MKFRPWLTGIFMGNAEKVDACLPCKLENEAEAKQNKPDATISECATSIPSGNSIRFMECNCPRCGQAVFKIAVLAPEEQSASDARKKTK